ncbi:MAG TPA: hypothetical protein VF521_13300 [Pyrinomonadaceae bacterium]
MSKRRVDTGEGLLCENRLRNTNVIMLGIERCDDAPAAFRVAFGKGANVVYVDLCAGCAPQLMAKAAQFDTFWIWALGAGVPPPGLERTIMEVRDHLARDRRHRPDNRHAMVKLSEEAGEVAEALLEGKPDRVRFDCLHVAALALRIALEGDADFPDVQMGTGAE